jgi:hypothetical protein
MALERTKAKELSAVVSDLRGQLDSANRRHAAAADCAQTAERRAETLAVRAQGLEHSVQQLEAAAKAAAERNVMERSSQVLT